ncbi:DUF5777 family beta-barrel protein [Dokdonia ponticola]|uniref:DUF5777 family beta-barrel protein n=1 Tax=Dokdonia ponticola TaxID=2041041 RepID=A0ABV9HXK2_9FLAO
MRNKFGIVVFMWMSLVQLSQAQDLGDLLEKEDMTTQSAYVMSTFKATRISIGHSVETRKKGALEISFMSRYWDIPQERSNSFIADRMSARFGVDYAFTDRFTVGIGGAAPSGIFDAFFKYRLFQQETNGNGSPFGVTFVQIGTYRSRQFTGVEVRNDFFDKTAFTTQLLVARKLTANLSLQVAPTFIHRSSTSDPIDDANHFAIGFGGRYKVTNHVSVVSEYYYLANELESRDTFGAFSLGANWEVGSVMLQFKMTNNPFFTEDSFITQTRSNFNFRDGNFFFGFQGTYYIQL